MSLGTWSPIGDNVLGTVMELLGGGALWEKVCH